MAQYVESRWEIFKKKLSNLVNSMVLDEKENIKIIKKNSFFIKKFLNKYALLNSLISLEYDNDKVLMFIEALDKVYKNKDIYYKDFFNTDYHGNNFLILASYNWDIEEILKLLEIVLDDRTYEFKDKILNHKNHFDITFLYNYIDVATKKELVNFNPLLTLFQSYIFNCDIKCVDGKTLFDLINENNDEMENATGWKQLKSTIYWYTINDNLHQLNGDKKHDTEIIEKIFGDVNYTDYVGSPLHYFVNGDGLYYDKFNHEIFAQIDKKIILSIVEKLLNIGINPNIKDGLKNETFIHYAISSFSSDSDFIIELIKLAQKYNYELNTTPSLVTTSLEKSVKRTSSYEFSYNIYSFLCLNGFVTRTADFDIKTINEYTPFLMIDTYLYKITNLYNLNSAIELLISELNNLGLQVEDKFKQEFIWPLENDFYFTDNILKFYENDINNNTNFINNWARAIKKQRDINISAIDKPVQLSESLEVLRNLTFEYENILSNEIPKRKVYKKELI